MERNIEQFMEQFKPPTEEDLQMTIYSLQSQLSKQIGDYTSLDVKYMKLQQEKAELEKEIEEYRKKEIEEMDGQSDAK